MQSNKVRLIGSEREPLGTRLGDQPGDEMIEVSVIVKPKTRAAIPGIRGVHISRQEFAAVHSGGASPGVSYSPPQVAQLYQFPTDVDGTGQTVGIIELGGGYTLASLTTYFSGQQINTPTVVSVLVDNAT